MLDRLPAEIVEKIMGELDCWPWIEALWLATVSRALLDPARRSVVRTINWPKKPESSEAILSFFEQHPAYRGSIQMVGIGLKSSVTPVSALVSFLINAPALRDLTIETQDDGFLVELGKAIGQPARPFRLVRLTLDVGVKTDEVAAIARLEGAISIINRSSATLEELTISGAGNRLANPSQLTIPSSPLPRLRKLIVDRCHTDIINSILLAASGDSLAWDSVEDEERYAQIDEAALAKVAHLELGDFDGVLTVSAVARLRSVRSIVCWRVDGDLQLAILSPQLGSLEIIVGEWHQASAIRSQLADPRVLPRLKKLEVFTAIDDGTTRAFKEYRDTLVAVLTSRGCETTVDW